MISITKRIGMRPEEEIIFFLRRHWFAILPLLFGFGFVLIIPFAAYFGLLFLQPEFLAVKTNFILFLLGASIFFLYAWLFLFQNFADWYLDVWIVTNQRIVNIEQRGLFGRVMSELMLYNIQDVTSEIKGFIPSMLDFGTVQIQTAAEKSQFHFEEVDHPSYIAKRILELASQQRTEKQEIDIKETK
jgi:hypothetical protein